MPSERVQRQIDGLLDEADKAMARLEWAVVRERAQAVLAADPENSDGRDYLAMAERGLDSQAVSDPVTASPVSASAVPPLAQPASFAKGRYTVRKFLGADGKKKGYLAHDALLDRDVAFALIKTDSLDEASRTRITREARPGGAWVTTRTSSRSMT